jgi:hypothetical protein
MPKIPRRYFRRQKHPVTTAPDRRAHDPFGSIDFGCVDEARAMLNCSAKRLDSSCIVPSAKANFRDPDLRPSKLLEFHRTLN